MLHGEEDSSSLVLVSSAMKRVSLVSVALATFILFFNTIDSLMNFSEIGIRTAHAVELDVWWPIDGARVEGKQPFKFSIDEGDIESFEGYWQVGDGALNEMFTSHRTHPHMEADVDLTNWTWRESGVYD